MTDRIDVLLRDATIVDGTGAPPVSGNVAVTGDRVVAVGETPADVDVGETVDVGGAAVCPGFVDVHTHDDWAVLIDPDHSCKTLQGVTSVVTGNCGMSPFPSTDLAGPGSGFERMDGYLGELESEPPAVNVAALVGHGSIRTAVMGLRTDRPSDRAERAAMADLLDEALAAGVVGMSSGLAYEPGCYAGADEIIELAGRVADAGGLYTTHMRDESDGLLDSIAESIEVAAVTGVPVQISHLKASGRAEPGTVPSALAAIDDARARGLDVMADQYPYTRGSTLLEQVVRAGAFDGTGPFGALTADDVHVAAAPSHPEWEGRTISELAADHGVAGREMADRMVAAAGRSCFVVLATMREDDVRTIMAHPVVMIGSDGVPVGDKPHPRLHHTYPRVLGHYRRELGVLDLATAVHRMTGMPARRFGLADRGVLERGAFADLVVFDPDTVADTGTYDDPATVPIGITGVWVNGTRVVDHGTVTGRRPGRVLRR